MSEPRHHAVRRPKPSRTFAWARHAGDGWVLYRLFRRDCRGRIHARPVTFRGDAARSHIAAALAAERRSFREAVDDVDLMHMGLVA